MLATTTGSVVSVVTVRPRRPLLQPSVQLRPRPAPLLRQVVSRVQVQVPGAGWVGRCGQVALLAVCGCQVLASVPAPPLRSTDCLRAGGCCTACTTIDCPLPGPGLAPASAASDLWWLAAAPATGHTSTVTPQSCCCHIIISSSFDHCVEGHSQ